MRSDDQLIHRGQTQGTDQADVQKLTAGLTAMQQEMSQLKAKIEKLDGRVSNPSDESLLSRFKNLLSSSQAWKQLQSQSQADVQKLTAGLTAMQQEMSQLKAKIEKLDGRVSNLSIEISGHSAKVEKLDGRVSDLSIEISGHSPRADSPDQYPLLCNKYVAQRDAAYLIIDGILKKAGLDAGEATTRCRLRVDLARELTEAWFEKESSGRTTQALLDRLHWRFSNVAEKWFELRHSLHTAIDTILRHPNASNITKALQEYRARVDQTKLPIDFRVATDGEPFDASVHKPVQGCPDSGHVVCTAFPGFFVTNAPYGSQSHIEVYVE